jgi:hypothetical protein
MMDGDSYINMDVLTNFLSKYDGRQPFYFGSPAKWLSYPFAHGGSVIVVSKGALDVTIGRNESIVQKYEQFAPHCCCGDAIVAVMLKDEANIDLNYDGSYMFNGNPIWDLKFKEDYWCKPIISFHHVSGHDIEVLWEYERSRGPQKGAITYSDVYRDFILPYIDNRLDYWDSCSEGATYQNDDHEYTIKSGEVVHPGTSAEMCERACLEGRDCLSWRYDHDDFVCTLWDKFKLGRSTREWLSVAIDGDSDRAKRAHHHVESGWNIDHIREFRSKSKCDSASRLIEMALAASSPVNGT